MCGNSGLGAVSHFVHVTYALADFWLNGPSKKISWPTALGSARPSPVTQATLL